MSAAILQVDGEALRQALKLPEGTRITALRQSDLSLWGENVVADLRIEHADLPVTPPGEMLRQVTPRFDENGFVSWQ